jgi:hypothetical protein
MSSGSPTLLLAIGIPAAVVTFLIVLFAFIITMVRRRFAQARAALEHEGIALESGPRWMTIRYSSFRARGMRIGAGINKTRGSLVLTRQGRIILMPGFQGRYWLVPPNITVGIAEDGRLHIHCDKPSGEGASGSIDYRIAMPEAAAWMTALTQAGAQPLAG